MMEKCEHKEIRAVTGRHGWMYPRATGKGANWEVEKGPGGEVVKCPCCGKEWECGRPDIHTSYCLKCADEEPVEDWRKVFPYERPDMEEFTAESIKGIEARLGKMGLK